MASQIASRVKPDFIKTSTGFGTAGVSAEDARLMKAGAERIGTSSGIRILEEFSRS